MKVLVTGGAGSIGVHVVRALLERGDTVTIVDSFNDFYDPRLKRTRLKVLLQGLPAPRVVEANIVDADALGTAFEAAGPDAVVHFAAWPGVRPSLQAPSLYARENIEGTVNVFEASVRAHVRTVVYASSSTVYGRTEPPFHEDERCDMPVSPYGVSKRAGEIYASMYHHVYGLSVACLRFFTVYGPWMRPDMALWKFTERIHAGQPIELHRFSEDGREVQRDFTHVNDILRAVCAALDRHTGFDIFNISAHDPVPLLRFVHAIEAGLGKRADIQEVILPPEAEVSTAADISRAQQRLGYAPTMTIEEGAREFTQWYEREFLPLFPDGLASSSHWTGQAPVIRSGTR